LEIWKNRT